MSKQIVALAEARSGELRKSSFEVVSAARRLAAATGDRVLAVLCGHDLENAAARLARSGAERVLVVRSPALASYSGDGYARAIREALQNEEIAAILGSHSATGRDLAPRIAAALEVGLVSDATELHYEDGKWGATKPVYAGKAYQKSFAKKSPFMATLRPNAFEVDAYQGPEAEIEIRDVEVAEASLLTVVQEIVAASGDRVPLQEAKVVVSGGRGLKEPGNFRLVEELAEAFGPGVAAVGASRAVVDAGWRPHREQVGQTGKVVSPHLYIACGISGAIQHLAGMRTSRYIVAINKDPEAPIFKVADYGIVGDALEVLPALTEAVKQAVSSN